MEIFVEMKIGKTEWRNLGGQKLKENIIYSWVHAHKSLWLSYGENLNFLTNESILNFLLLHKF